MRIQLLMFLLLMAASVQARYVLRADTIARDTIVTDSVAADTTKVIPVRWNRNPRPRSSTMIQRKRSATELIFAG